MVANVTTAIMTAGTMTDSCICNYVSRETQQEHSRGRQGQATTARQEGGQRQEGNRSAMP